MRASSRLLLLRALGLVAVSASVALTIDYLSAVPSFCAADSGCGVIRDSGLGRLEVEGLGSVPVLPLLGLAVFATLFGSSLAASARFQRQVTAPLAWAVAPAGLILLLTQAWLGAFCWLCVTVDLAALGAGAVVFSLRGDGWERAARELGPGPVLARRAWFALGALSLLGPGLYPLLVEVSPTPSVIRELYAPGKINVVEFFDFGCPHCRELGPRLETLLHPYGERVHFVRRHVPLEMHPGAREAARLALCAEEQGQGEPVSRAFLSAPSLDPLELEPRALALGLDEPKLRACLASQRPDARLQEDRARLETAGFEGLPTTYIGGTRVLGAMPNELYQDALERAARGADSSGLQPLTYWGLVGLLGALLAGLAWPRPARNA